MITRGNINDHTVARRTSSKDGFVDYFYLTLTVEASMTQDFRAKMSPSHARRVKADLDSLILHQLYGDLRERLNEVAYLYNNSTEQSMEEEARLKLAMIIEELR